MKKIIHILSLAAFILAMASCVGNKNPANPGAAKMITSVYYTCRMHPAVHRDEQGNCPICGMELIRKEEQKADTSKVIQRTDSSKLN